MALILCEECGKEISDKAAFCPNCGCPIGARTNIPLPEPEPKKKEKKKDSVLSILAIIFSLFIITSFVGLILAIIDLALNDKSKRHLGSWIAIIFFLLFCFTCASNLSRSDSEKTQTVQQEQQQPAPTPASPEENVPQDDGIIFIESKDYTVKYLRHKLTQDYFGNDCLAVYYEFTNNSSEDASFVYSFSEQAFQNGIELDKSFFSLKDEERNSSREIKPGVTIEVYSLFEYKDNSDVELEVSELFTFDDSADSMILSLE